MSKTKRKSAMDGLFRQNIALMSGLVTAPIIVAATTVERALVLVVSFFLISYTSILLCRFFSRKIVYSFRILLYAIVAAVMFIPTAYLMRLWLPQTTNDVMIYIELTVVNSLLLAKTETRFYLKPYGEMAVDALVYIAGYAIAAFAVGFVREVLAFGTLFNLRLCDPIMPAAKSPFFGFVLLGIFAALCRALSGRRRGKRPSERSV